VSRSLRELFVASCAPGFEGATEGSVLLVTFTAFAPTFVAATGITDNFSVAHCSRLADQDQKNSVPVSCAEGSANNAYKYDKNKKRKGCIPVSCEEGSAANVPSTTQQSPSMQKTTFVTYKKPFFDPAAKSAEPAQFWSSSLA
jgi:hypothetical protein